MFLLGARPIVGTMSLADDFLLKAGRSIIGVFGVDGLSGEKGCAADLGEDMVLGIWLKNLRINGRSVGTVAPMRWTPGSIIDQLVVATEK